MNKLLDLSGFKKDKITVLNFHKLENKQRRWLCQCECGKTSIKSTGEITRKNRIIKSSCCLKRYKDLTNLKFNNLTVLKFSHRRNKYIIYWLCRCICGTEKVIQGKSLTLNRVISCGCIKKTGSDLFMEKAKKKLLSKIKISDSGCWEWQGLKNPGGYGVMCFTKLKIQTVHRISWTIFNGKIPYGLYICHHCDNKICCNPKHLYAGTAKDNSRDALERGLHPHGPNKKKGLSGEKNNKSKLTSDQVKEIKKIYSTTQTSYVKLSKIYGVHTSTIANIIRGITWKCLQS